MVTADKCKGACGFMDDSYPCETAAVAARRRRMEIRRFKAICSANPFVEQLIFAVFKVAAIGRMVVQYWTEKA
jgi:hypothetical protein